MKKSKLDLTSIVMISIIAALGIFSVTVLIGIMYYFVSVITTVQTSIELTVVSYFTYASFTVCTVILLAEALHTILYKAIESRKFEKKENPKFVKFAYWFILIMVSIGIMLVFNAVIPNFNSMFLLMLLLILKVTQVMIKYTFMEFEVSKEDKTLLYLVFSILVVVMFVGEFLIAKSLFEPQFNKALNNAREFYNVADIVEKKIENESVEDVRQYIDWATARTDNQDVKKYGETISKVLNNENDIELPEVQKAIKALTNTSRKNMEVFEKEITADGIKRNMLVVLVNISLVAIVSFICFGEAEFISYLKETRKAEKETKKTTKTAAKKTTAKKVTKK